MLGFPQGHISLERHGKGRAIATQELPPSVVLGLADLPFVSNGAAVCASMARATLNGKNIELSGGDTFNEIIRPLTKALRHLEAIRRVDKAPARPEIGMCIALLDAPMILVKAPGSEPALCPWVRIVRRESKKRQSATTSRTFTIDAVHIAYLETFVASHLLPFVEAVAIRLGECPWAIQGRGVVQSLDEWAWSNISEV